MRRFIIRLSDDKIRKTLREGSLGAVFLGLIFAHYRLAFYLIDGRPTPIAPEYAR